MSERIETDQSSIDAQHLDIQASTEIQPEIEQVVSTLFRQHPQGEVLRPKTLQLLLKHPGTIACWKAGQLIGPGTEGVRNIVEHQALSGLAVQTLGEAAGVDQAMLAPTEEAMLRHDWDKMAEKLAGSKGGITQQNGYTWVNDADQEQIIRCESSKTGIARVTGSDFRDFSDWGIQEYLARIADNSLAMPDGYQDIVDPRTVRFPYLRENCKPVHESGRALYNGIGTFDFLEEITDLMEPVVHTAIVQRHPELRTFYPETKDIIRFTRDRILELPPGIPVELPSVYTLPKDNQNYDWINANSHLAMNKHGEVF